MPLEVTYRQFADDHDKETWHGMSTAFRNGIKCAVQGGECNYTRIDFAEAWFRGFELATKFIEEGNTIRIRFDYQMWKTMQRTIDDLTRERNGLKQRVETNKTAALHCHRSDCNKLLTPDDYHVLTDDNGALYVSCSLCCDLPYPLSELTGSPALLATEMESPK